MHIPTIGKHEIFNEFLKSDELGKFITFPNEHVIIAVREHHLALFIRLVKILAVTTLIMLFTVPLVFIFLQSLLLSLSAFFFLALSGAYIIIQELVHWYLHLYIATNRKIIEVRYNPLFSETSDSVLLDQIRCTEIDAELYGFTQEILDIGDVKLTFDRPTHHEEFIMKNVRSPRKIANYLSVQLNKKENEQEEKQMWFRDPNTKKLKYLTEGEMYGNLSN